MKGPRPTRRARAPEGFTLIELLVAVFLLAVLSAFAYGTLSYVEKAREATQTSFAREKEIEFAVHTMVTDFEQLAPRPIREPLGTNYLPALSADPRYQDLVVLTRGGWSNSAGLPRSTQQRVSYRYDKDRAVLVRSYTNVLDAPLSAQPVSHDLLTHLDSVTIRYMPGAATTATAAPATNAPATPTPTAPVTAPVPINASASLDTSTWLDQWPPAGTASQSVVQATPGIGAPANTTNPAAAQPVLPRLRPRAVEITLELKDYGKIVRLVEVPG